MVWAPFFIVGCPRSGTTLLNVLIDAHPDIAIPPESFIFQRCGMLFDTCGDLNDDRRLRALVGEMLDDERIRDWRLDTDVDRFCAGLEVRSPRGVVTRLFELYAAQQGKRLWGDKTPHHALCVERIIRVFPDARIIHLVRDGRDVAESMSRIRIGPQSLWAIGRRWSDFIMAMRAAKAAVPPGQFLEIYYETLVREPNAVRAQVFAFLGVREPESLPADMEVPDSAIRRQAVGAVPHHAMLKGPVSDSKVGVFKRRFSAREIEIFETVARDALLHHGYELTTAASARYTAIEALRAFWLDNFVRYARKLAQPHAVRQLGFELRLELQLRRRRRRCANQASAAKGTCLPHGIDT